MSQFATAAELRTFMDLTGTTGQKSTDSLDLLLQSSSDWLEAATGRRITADSSNRTFSTNGQPFMVIPDLRSATSVTLQSTVLTADTSYWLKPSREDPTVFTGINVRPWGQGRVYSYLANPEWWDRNLDSPLARYYGTLPNDLVIAGSWGHLTTPPEWKVATMALAAYTFAHRDALFAAAKVTPEGNLLDLSRYPTEVQALLTQWTNYDQVSIT